MAVRAEAIAVIFRTYLDAGREVIALFPYEVADVDGRYITCYVHHGQHGQADYTGVMGDTRAATVAERTPLLRELRQIGYDHLRVIRRRGNRRGARRRS